MSDDFDIARDALNHLTLGMAFTNDENNQANSDGFEALARIEAALTDTERERDFLKRSLEHEREHAASEKANDPPKEVAARTGPLMPRGVESPHSPVKSDDSSTPPAPTMTVDPEYTPPPRKKALATDTAKWSPSVCPTCGSDDPEVRLRTLAAGSCNAASPDPFHTTMMVDPEEPSE